MAPRKNPDNSTRLAGIALALTFLLWLAAVAVGMFVIGEPEGGADATMAQEATLINENADAFQMMGYLVMFAGVIGAFAAFRFARGDTATRPLSNMGWTMVAVAHVAFISMGALIATALRTAAASQATNGALFQSVFDLQIAMDGIAGLVASLGLAAVFFTQHHETTARVPALIGLIVAVVAVLAAAGSAGELLGLNLDMFFFALLPLFVATSYWGIAIAFRPRAKATTTKRGAAA